MLLPSCGWEQARRPHPPGQYLVSLDSSGENRVLRNKYDKCSRHRVTLGQAVSCACDHFLAGHYMGIRGYFHFGNVLWSLEKKHECELNHIHAGVTKISSS